MIFVQNFAANRSSKGQPGDDPDTPRKKEALISDKPADSRTEVLDRHGASQRVFLRCGIFIRGSETDTLCGRGPVVLSLRFFGLMLQGPEIPSKAEGGLDGPPRAQLVAMKEPLYKEDKQEENAGEG